VAVISDFGISRVTSLTITTSTIGTLLFMPPEVLKGQAHSKSSDIFALGMMMWMLITKKTNTTDVYPEVTGEAIFDIPSAVKRGIRPPVTREFPPKYAITMERYADIVLSFCLQLYTLC
jgi:serine/threonine protein kinase